jgi:hypothetical protein
LAIRAVTPGRERIPTIDELVAATGMSRRAAALYRLILSGDTLVDDREFVPDDRRAEVIRAEEGAEAKLLAELAREA